MSSNDASIGWQERLPTVSLQAEYFYLKFPDVGREKLLELKDVFVKFDSRKVGELQEDEALRLLEYRGETKRVVELRQMVKEMDYDHNRELSFLEWACAYFNKSWRELHQPGVNQEDIDRAMAKFRIAMEKEIEAGEMARKKAEEIRQHESKHEELEEEKVKVAEKELQRKEEEKRVAEEQRRAREDALGQQGIKGMTAKFHYAASDTKDTTKDNETKIKFELEVKRKKKMEEERIELEKKRTNEEKQKAQEEKEKAEEEKKQAEKEKAAAEEERKQAEQGSAETIKRKQEELKKKEEDDKRLADEKEKERKAKVQAKLKEKFGGSNK